MKITFSLFFHVLHWLKRKPSLMRFFCCLKNDVIFLFHLWKCCIRPNYFLEFSEYHSQNIWLLDSQHICYYKITLRLSASSADMIFKIGHSFYDGADFIIKRSSQMWYIFFLVSDLTCFFLSFGAFLINSFWLDA